MKSYPDPTAILKTSIPPKRKTSLLKRMPKRARVF
ncbi:Uncharacterised protein [Neisseria gonorrhoeae]|uniref:Uncharacterized protein n=1 Tax=Neisseria gonorrhoeae TaxID=485 RepID=A0A378W098_NEIGO|nr:Uncharacterised protein [Neisseria gonorrhoeae]